MLKQNEKYHLLYKKNAPIIPPISFLRKYKKTTPEKVQGLTDKTAETYLPATDHSIPTRKIHIIIPSALGTMTNIHYICRKTQHLTLKTHNHEKKLFIGRHLRPFTMGHFMPTACGNRRLPDCTLSAANRHNSKQG